MTAQKWLDDNKIGVVNMETGETLACQDARALKNPLQYIARYEKTELSNIRVFCNDSNVIQWILSYYEKCLNHFDRFDRMQS
jgi:cell division septal protein FtsQ